MVLFIELLHFYYISLPGPAAGQTDQDIKGGVWICTCSLCSRYKSNQQVENFLLKYFDDLGED
jgi:hypothetical protein